MKRSMIAINYYSNSKYISIHNINPNYNNNLQKSMNNNINNDISRNLNINE